MNEKGRGRKRYLLSNNESEVQFLSLKNGNEEIEKTSEMRLTITIWNYYCYLNEEKYRKYNNIMIDN